MPPVPGEGASSIFVNCVSGTDLCLEASLVVVVGLVPQLRVGAEFPHLGKCLVLARGYMASSCAMVGYLPCQLVEQASLCPYWCLIILLILILKIKISSFPSVRTPQGRVSLNVLGPEVKERRWITVLHIYIYMLKGFLIQINISKCTKI